MKDVLAKYKGMNVQAKAAIWFALCSILQKGISVITVPIFSRLLTAEQYGTYSLYVSWLQLLTIITSLYLYYEVFNNAMSKFDRDRDVYVSSMQGLTLTITTVVFVIYLVAYQSWSELLELSPTIMLLMFAEMAVTPALFFWSGRQRFEYRYKRLVIITLAKAALNPLLGLVMVLLSEDKATARVASVVIVEVIFCGVIMARQFAKGKHFFHAKYWKYALGLAIPLLPHYLSGMILSQGDRVMISQMVGKAEVAFYSVAYSIGMLTQTLVYAINNSLTPWMYAKFKAKNFDGVHRTLNLLLVLVGVILVGIMILSPELIWVFGSDEYAGAAYVIPPVAASVFFIFLYHLLAIPQFYYEKTKFLAVSSFVAAAVNIILNYFFIGWFGYIAAGYTTLACYVVYSLGHYLVSGKVLKECAEGREFYDKRFMFAISVTIIGISIGCNFLTELWVIRYVLIAAICVVALIKRRDIMDLIKGVRKK